MKKIYKMLLGCLFLALFFAQSDIIVLSKNTNDSSEKFIRTIHSENDTDADRVADFDAKEEDGIGVEGLGPKKDYEVVVEDDAFLFPEGSPSITFERYPTQGKKASELLPGEWMFDQEFARGLLFDQFNIARNTPSNWKLKNNDGSWYSVGPITNNYVWDENLEVVAMQRAIEQVGTDGHIRPNGGRHRKPICTTL